MPLGLNYLGSLSKMPPRLQSSSKNFSLASFISLSILLVKCNLSRAHIALFETSNFLSRTLTKALPSSSSSFEPDKDGKYKCKIYEKRPRQCRAFPLQCDVGISKAEHIGCEGIKKFKKQWDWIINRRGWEYWSSTSVDKEIELIS